MVDYAALKAADPGKPQSASQGWVEPSKEAWQAVDDIHSHGVGPLKEDRQDPVGEVVGEKLAEQVWGGRV